MRGVRSVSDSAAGNNAVFMRALEAEAALGWGGPQDPVSPGEKHRASPLLRALATACCSSTERAVLETLDTETRCDISSSHDAGKTRMASDAD